jgi:diguanylate cyclase (GGDEF)-like protein
MPYSEQRRQRYLKRRLVELSYSNATSSLLVNCLALMVAYFSLNVKEVTWLNVWAVFTTVIMGTRLVINTIYQQRYPQGLPDETSLDRVLFWRLCFRVGAIAAPLPWAWLCLAALPHASRDAQFEIIVIVSALASGATAVMASEKVIGKLFIGLLLIPGSAALLIIEPPLTLMAMLGLIFFVVMALSHHNNHQMIVNSLELTFENEKLLHGVTQQNEEIRELNQKLEERVQERTSALEKMASTDSLTTLLNRSGLLTQLSEIADNSREVHVYFVDLDRFKQINDSKGHEVGDRVLKQISLSLRQVLPEGSLVARWGGDEFVICFMDRPCSQETLSTIFESLTTQMFLDNGILEVNGTIGYAVYPHDAPSINEAIGAADLAATHLKQHGRRGELLRFNQSLATKIVRKSVLSEHLAHFETYESLYLEYQPIVDQHQEVIAFEALCRMYVPDLGLVPPDEFIELAEENGQINALGDWVLRNALKQLSQIYQQGHKVTLSVNVSPLQVKQKAFDTRLLTLCAQYQVPTSALAIEITESFLEDDEVEGIIERLNIIVDHGFKLYIDDFGKGYSSLSRLRDLPVTTLKIDRSFVWNMNHEADVLLESILFLAKKFNLDVIAEGVETQAQFETLKSMGCPQFQGFLFGRPEPESRFKRPLEEGERLTEPAQT